MHSVDPGVFSVSSATAKSPNFLRVSSIRRSINKLGSTTVLLQPGAGGGDKVSSTSATTDLEKPISSSVDRKADSFIVKRPESILFLGSLERFGLEVALVSSGLYGIEREGVELDEEGKGGAEAAWFLREEVLGKAGAEGSGWGVRGSELVDCALVESLLSFLSFLEVETPLLLLVVAGLTTTPSLDSLCPIL